MRKSTHNVRYQKLISALREARKEQALTQVDLAKQLKRPQSFVAKYEQGERRLDVIEFLTIAKVLGLDPMPLLRSAHND